MSVEMGRGPRTGKHLILKQNFKTCLTGISLRNYLPEGDLEKCPIFMQVMHFS